MSLNPFQPFASILGIRIYDVPVVEENLWYFETLGSDFWLCYDLASLKSCVARTDSSRVSFWSAYPQETVKVLQLAVQAEADGLLAA